MVLSPSRPGCLWNMGRGAGLVVVIAALLSVTYLVWRDAVVVIPVVFGHQPTQNFTSTTSSSLSPRPTITAPDRPTITASKTNGTSQTPALNATHTVQPHNSTTHNSSGVVTTYVQVELLGGWPVQEGGTCLLRAQRRTDTCGAPSVPLTVHLSFSGSATLGRDFRAPTTLVIAVGSNSTDAIVDIMDDADPEAYETIVPNVLNVVGLFPEGNCSAAALPSDGAALIVDDDRPACKLSQHAVGTWRVPEGEWRIPRYVCAREDLMLTFQSGLCQGEVAMKQRGETPDPETNAIFEPSECSILWTTFPIAREEWQNRTIIISGDSVTRHHAAELNCWFLHSFNKPQDTFHLYVDKTLPCSALAPPDHKCQGSPIQCFQWDGRGGNYSRLCYLEAGVRDAIRASELIQHLAEGDSRLAIANGTRDVWLINFGLHLPAQADAIPFANAMERLYASRSKERRPNVWFRDVSAQHFPAVDGSGDFWKAPTHRRNSCVPITNYTLARTATTFSFFEIPLANAGVPIMRTWDATVQRYMDHYCVRWNGVVAPFDLLDCTHYCYGSAVYNHWNRLLFHHLRKAGG